MNSFAELDAWVSIVLAEDRARFGISSDSLNEFLLMQMVKLGEEVGELSAELLALTGYQREYKAGMHDRESLEAECADVAITLAILAGALRIDLGEAISRKIAARPSS